MLHPATESALQKKQTTSLTRALLQYLRVRSSRWMPIYFDKQPAF